MPLKIPYTPEELGACARTELTVNAKQFSDGKGTVPPLHGLTLSKPRHLRREKQRHRPAPRICPQDRRPAQVVRLGFLFPGGLAHVHQLPVGPHPPHNRTPSLIHSSLIRARVQPSVA